MMSFVYYFFLLCDTFPTAPCQGQVVSTERGEVEFVGLEEWTAAELADTLRALSPDQSLYPPKLKIWQSASYTAFGT